MGTMIDYIKMICMDLPKDMVGRAATPAANHLFRTDDENATPPPLDKDRADLFIHLTMQLLFLSQRARPDIWTMVLFLCRCIQHPDDHDYKKLARVMKYLQSTIDLPLVLSADGSGMPHVLAYQCVICSTYGHEESYRRGNDARKWISVQHVRKAEAGDMQLYRG
jgi:hypothetical protein